MTDQQPQDASAEKAARTRHRRTVGAGHRALLVAGVLVAVLLLVLGYVVANVRRSGNQSPAAAASAAPSAGARPDPGARPGTSEPAGPSGPAAPSESAGPSGPAAPGGSAGPADNGTPAPGAPKDPSNPTSPAPGRTAPPTESGKQPPAESGKQPPTESGKQPPAESGKQPPAESGKQPPAESGKRPPAERPAPRLVGPRDLAGFTALLNAFCQQRGDRAAVLLEGPNQNRATGDWACVKVVTFTKVNLDEACRDAFGDASQARQATRGDARTWRCFDS